MFSVSVYIESLNSIIHILKIKLYTNVLLFFHTNIFVKDVKENQEMKRKKSYQIVTISRMYTEGNLLDHIMRPVSYYVGNKVFRCSVII